MSDSFVNNSEGTNYSGRWDCIHWFFREYFKIGPLKHYTKPLLSNQLFDGQITTIFVPVNRAGQVLAFRAGAGATKHLEIVSIRCNSSPSDQELSNHTLLIDRTTSLVSFHSWTTNMGRNGICHASSSLLHKWNCFGLWIPCRGLNLCHVPPRQNAQANSSPPTLEQYILQNHKCILKLKMHVTCQQADKNFVKLLGFVTTSPPTNSSA